MNEKQKKWIEGKKAELDEFFRNNYPLTDTQAEQAVQWIEKTVDMAKGNKDDCRAEVREALFDVLEKWERKFNERKVLDR